MQPLFDKDVLQQGMSDVGLEHNSQGTVGEEERKKKASKAERVAKGVGSQNLWYNAFSSDGEAGCRGHSQYLRRD